MPIPSASCLHQRCFLVWTMTPGMFVPEVCAIIMIRTFHFQISAPLSHSPYLLFFFFFVCVVFGVCVYLLLGLLLLLFVCFVVFLGGCPSLSISKKYKLLQKPSFIGSEKIAAWGPCPKRRMYKYERKRQDLPRQKTIIICINANTFMQPAGFGVFVRIFFLSVSSFSCYFC